MPLFYLKIISELFSVSKKAAAIEKKKEISSSGKISVLSFFHSREINVIKPILNVAKWSVNTKKILFLWMVKLIPLQFVATSNNFFLFHWKLVRIFASFCDCRRIFVVVVECKSEEILMRRIFLRIKVLLERNKMFFDDYSSMYETTDVDEGKFWWLFVVIS